MAGERHGHGMLCVNRPQTVQVGGRNHSPFAQKTPELIRWGEERNSFEAEHSSLSSAEVRNAWSHT